MSILNGTQVQQKLREIMHATMLSWKTFTSILMGVNMPPDEDMRPQTGQFYAGTRFLTPVTRVISLPIDQVNFLVSCFFCIGMGFFMRHVATPARLSPKVRGLIEAVLGLLVLTFCFGNQVRVLLLQAAVAYMIMLCIPCRRFAAILVTIWSMAYLTAVHLCRMYYDFEGYTLDISGPIMITTQRLSSLAFNLLDGQRVRELEESKRLHGKLGPGAAPLASDSPDGTRVRPRTQFSYQKVLEKRDPGSPQPLPASVTGAAVAATPAASNSKRTNEDGPSRRQLRQRSSSPLGGMHEGFPSSECLIADQGPKSPDEDHGLGPNVSAGFSRAHAPSLRNSLRNSMQALNSSFKPIIQAFRETPIEKMPKRHIDHAVVDRPDVIEFTAYVLYFHGANVGPFVFYRDYRAYLAGYENKRLPPLAPGRFLRTLFQAGVFGMLTGYVANKFPFTLVNSQEFKLCSFTKQVMYSWASLFLVRQKYYLAWSLAEAMGIAAGNGFSGFNANTQEAEWAHVTNFDFLSIECGLSLKNVVDGWNISTTHWLREVFYDRAPAWCKTLAVFVISAFWHGFYTGYYMMFLTFAMFTFTSRMWHREMRRFFRPNHTIAYFYDLLTLIATNLAMNYAQTPFHLLDWKVSLLYWLNFYYVPHIVSAVILTCGYLKLYSRSCMRSRRRKRTSKNEPRQPIMEDHVV